MEEVNHYQERGLDDSTLNVLNQQLIETSAENQYVTFQIAGDEYGIEIVLVQEIVRYTRPTRVFNADPIVDGVTNFRGQVIPLINMHRKFQMEEVEYDAYTVVIVIRDQERTMGMIVDRVSDIRSFNEEEIQKMDEEFADDIKAAHIKGIARSDGRIVMLLDPSRILRFEGMKNPEGMTGVEERENK